MPLTIGAKCTLQGIGPTSRLVTAPEPRDKLHQLHEVLGAKVALPLGQRDERMGRRQVRPRPRNRGYGAVGSLVPDPLTVSAGPFGDPNELLARERVERVGDADPRRRR